MNIPEYNTEPVGIGGSRYYGNGLTGNIDEVRFWNRALTMNEIVANLCREIKGSENGLIAFYQFNEGTAGGNNAGIEVLPDVSSNGNQGDLNGFGLNGFGFRRFFVG